MEVIRTAAISFGYAVWQLRPPTPSMTVVCKVTYDIVPDGVATPAAEQPPCVGDLFVDEDPERSLEYGSDYALVKPRGEFLFKGTCYPPGGPAPQCPVVVKVGELEKIIAVFGDRHWDRSQSLPSNPIPFEKMPLRWDLAFGGPRSPSNPHGIGMESADTADGKRVPLPNLELPGRLIANPSDRPPPAGLFPLGPGTPIRAKLSGTYDANWQKHRWPWFPEDFRPEFFNSAPADQRIAGFWRGDENILVRHAHRKWALLRTQLPGQQVRAYLRNVGDPDHALREVPLRLDTIHVDTDVGEFGQVSCVWRGAVEVADATLEHIQHVFVSAHPLGAQPTVDDAVIAFRKAVAVAAEAEEDGEDDGAPEPAADLPPLPDLSELPDGPDGAKLTDPKEVQVLYLMSGIPLPPVLASWIEASLNPGAAPPAPAAAEPPPEIPEAPPRDLAAARADAQARLAAGEGLAGEDLSDLDLRGLPLAGVDFSDAILANATLTGADLQGANLAGASLVGAKLDDANFDGADLSGADLSGATAARVTMRAAILDGAVAEDLSAPDADWSGIVATGTILMRAKLGKLRAEGANFAEADLTAADLSEGDLGKANLAATTLERAHAPNINLRGANLAELRGSGGANLRKGDLREVEAAQAKLMDAHLEGANLSFANLEGADLTGAQLGLARLHGSKLMGARLIGASLLETGLVKANCFEACFANADLRRADLRGANCFGGNFGDAQTEGAQLELANLGRTGLA